MHNTLELFALTIIEDAKDDDGECRHCGELLDTLTHASDCPTLLAWKVLISYHNQHTKEYSFFKRVENALFGFDNALFGSTKKE